MNVTRSDSHILDIYTPKSYPHKITFFRSEESHAQDFSSMPEYAEIVKDPAMGWNEFSTTKVDVHIVPGDHVTMLTEPHVSDLALQLRQCIYQALTNSRVK